MAALPPISSRSSSSSLYPYYQSSPVLILSSKDYTGGLKVFTIRPNGSSRQRLSSSTVPRGLKVFTIRIRSSLMNLIMAFSVGGSVDESQCWRLIWHVLDHVLLLNILSSHFPFLCTVDVKWDMCEESTQYFLSCTYGRDLLMIVPFCRKRN